MGSSENWKNAPHLQKHGLDPLPEDFEPTEEEKILINMYETVKEYERVAARLRDEENRGRLAARNAEFHEKMAPKKNKRKRNERAASGDVGEESGDNERSPAAETVTADHMADADEEESAREKRREEKLQALRKEVEEKRKAQQDKEKDELVAQHLTTSELEEGPLKKKQRATTSEEQQQSSLIANLKAASTPPHNFSEKLQLRGGKDLFTVSANQAQWTPPAASHPNEGAFQAILDDFDVSQAQDGSGSNTVAIKFMAPADAKRFSVNIATKASSESNFDSILFHLNPRHYEKGGQLVVNDKQEGTWGQAVSIPLSQVPIMFGQESCTLIIQITGEGFDIFVEGKHCARLEHRREIESGDLVLQFPSTDDYGNPENWSVFKVWWGCRAIMAQGDVSRVAGVNSFNSVHPRKLFVSSLPKTATQHEVDLRRAELERAFKTYGGDLGAQVVVPMHATYAFVELESESQTDLALRELGDKYRLNRARRTRHEALQEERSALEAAARGDMQEASNWD